MEGHESVVNLLLDADVDVLIRDFEHKTALDVTVGLGDRVLEAIQNRAVRQRMQQASWNRLSYL